MWKAIAGVGHVQRADELALEIGIYSCFHVPDPVSDLLGLLPLVSVEKGNSGAIASCVSNGVDVGQITVRYEATRYWLRVGIIAAFP